MTVESWVVSEPYAGLKAQAFGLAEAAGLSPETLDLHPRRPFSWVAAAWWPMPLRAVGLRQAPSGIVFSAGGTGAAVGAAARRAGAQVVQVQNPRMKLARFDVVVANPHDRISGPNVIIARTALHRARPELLAAAHALWAPRFAHLPRPLVAVLVGGSNGRFRLAAAEAQALAHSLAGLMAQDGVGLVLTPSRRTAAGAAAALRQALVPRGAWIWDGQGDNPYYGMLACADAIIVTIDSISMVSEAVATKAPVLLAELPGGSRRIADFLDLLKDAGRVRPFTGRLEMWPVARLDDTQAAADEVRHRLHF